LTFNPAPPRAWDSTNGRVWPLCSTIGVRIYYSHDYKTPLETFVGGGSGFNFTRSNVMRMEPIL
jgi:hypothetical protein